MRFGLIVDGASDLIEIRTKEIAQCVPGYVTFCFFKFKIVTIRIIHNSHNGLLINPFNVSSGLL